jgi:hypothetical protein
MAEPGTRGAQNEPEADNGLLVDTRAYLAFADSPKKDKQVETRSGISNAPALICETYLERPADYFARCRNVKVKALTRALSTQSACSGPQNILALIKDG